MDVRGKKGRNGQMNRTKARIQEKENIRWMGEQRKLVGKVIEAII